MRGLWLAGLALLIALSGPVHAQDARAEALQSVRDGNEAYKAGRFDEAAAAFQTAIDSKELDDDPLAITLNNRGVALAELDRFDAAIADYEASLALRPDDRTTIKNLRVAHVRRGDAHLSAGDDQDAMTDYDVAIRLEPGHHVAYLRRAALYEQRGELALALADYTRAEALEPDNETALDGLSRIKGRLASSAPETETKTEPGPGGAEAPARLGAPDTTTATADAAPSGATPEIDEPVAMARSEAAVAAPIEPAAAPPVPAVADDEGEVYRAVQAVNVRSGPDNSYESIGAIESGIEVRVTGDTLGWKHVILPNGRRGFIYKKWLAPAEG